MARLYMYRRGYFRKKHDHMNQAPSSEHNFEYHHTVLEPMTLDISKRAAFPYALEQAINPLGATQSELKRRFYEYDTISALGTLGYFKVLFSDGCVVAYEQPNFYSNWKVPNSDQSGGHWETTEAGRSRGRRRNRLKDRGRTNENTFARGSFQTPGPICPISVALQKSRVTSLLARNLLAKLAISNSKVRPVWTKVLPCLDGYNGYDPTT